MKAIEHFKIECRIGNGAGAADMTIPMSVPRYELMVLRAIHNKVDDDGAEMQMVTVKGREIVPLPFDDDGVQVWDARQTLVHLRAKYGNKRNGKVVSRIFKHSKSLARVVTILDIPNDVKGPIPVPKGVKASTIATKLMAAKAPAPKKPVVKKATPKVKAQKFTAEHRAAA